MSTDTLSPAIRRARSISARRQADRAALIENIEWLLDGGSGAAYILETLGYSKNPLALERRLYRCQRPDLIQRIFHHPKGRP